MSDAIKILSISIFVIAGIVGMILTIPILYAIGGLLLVIAGFFIFPAVLVIAPWYDLIANGHWLLLAITYGPWPVCGGLLAISDAIDRKRR